MIELHAFATKAGRQACKHKLQVCIYGPDHMLLILYGYYNYEKIVSAPHSACSSSKYFLNMLISKETHMLRAQEKWVGEL